MLHYRSGYLKRHTYAYTLYNLWEKTVTMASLHRECSVEIFINLLALIWYHIEFFY